MAEARKRLATYGARVGETFAFGAELTLKRAEFATIEADLAASGETGDAQSRKAA